MNEKIREFLEAKIANRKDYVESKLKNITCANLKVHYQSIFQAQYELEFYQDFKDNVIEEEWYDYIQSCIDMYFNEITKSKPMTEVSNVIYSISTIYEFEIKQKIYRDLISLLKVLNKE